MIAGTNVPAGFSACERDGVLCILAETMPESLPKSRRSLVGVGDAPLVWCDRFSEGLLYLMVLFSPWAFGTTQPWSVSVMNGGGYLLGGLWLFKLGLRWAARRQESGPGVRPGPRWLSVSLATLTVLVLAYLLIGAGNARAVYYPRELRFEYRSYISWLPHSYDQTHSWQWFWNALAWSAVFWAVRDWLFYDLEKEQGRTPRWHRLLWVISLNGALVALQGLFQRAEGSTKLLWIVEPRVNKSPDSFFGPYAYRANAAQYLNLVWPVILGLWCALQRPGRKKRPVRSRHLLLPCAALTAISPVVSASRGGALVTGIGVALSCLILLIFQKRSRGWKLGVLVAGLTILLFGWILGGDILQSRMREIESGFEIREAMFKTARVIARDYPLFGTGAGSFDALFQLYRSSPDEYWPAQLHDDWLETLMTWGWLGGSLIWAALALAWFRPLTGGKGLRADVSVVLFFWVALGGCLIHARYDFPFQVYSIVFLFMILCALLSCLKVESNHEKGSRLKE